MLERARARLTYANVVSSLALLVAVSTGGAYAANTIGSSDIIDDSIVSQDVKNLTLKGSDLAADSVSSAKIIDAAVRTADISDGAVGTGDLANDAVTTGKIFDGSVGTVDLANDAVTSAKVADGAITSAHVLDDSQAGGGLAATDLAPDSVGESEIATDAVKATEVADDSIDSGEVLDFGLSNQDVGVLFAQVNADGTVLHSSGGVTTIRLAMGSYDVDFGRDISSCAFVSTQGEGGVGGAGGAVIGVTDRSGNAEAVYATVRSDAGAFVDRAFQIVVVC